MAREGSGMLQKTRPAFVLNNPYVLPQWPTVTSSSVDVILQLLDPLLAPISHYRTHLKLPSKGKRSKKRKRNQSTHDQEPLPLSPPPPSILSHITVGFNATVQHLEALCNTQSASQTGDDRQDSAPTPLAVVFVVTPQDSPLASYLPALVSMASLKSDTSIRLVALPPSAHGMLSQMLSVPRVNILGVMADADNAEGLFEFTNKNVELVDNKTLEYCKHVREAYQPVKIGSFEIPVRKTKEKKRDESRTKTKAS